jgi:hypothetical protein
VSLRGGERAIGKEGRDEIVKYTTLVKKGCDLGWWGQRSVLQHNNACCVCHVLGVE